MVANNKRESEPFWYKKFWNDSLSHIYVEEEVAGSRLVKAALDAFPNRRIVPIKDYKDLFYRPGQEFLVQKESPKLVLAHRADNFLCKDTNNNYHTPMMINCLYNCAYCHLQALYPSANVVAFVNPEDYLSAALSALPEPPAHINLSNDTDILAWEHIFGYVHIWADFARKHTKTTFEVRTKSANFESIADIKPVSNMILSWSISAEQIINSYEEGAPSLSERLKDVKTAMQKGWNVRLYLDPVPDIQASQNLVKQLVSIIDMKGLYDVSVGGYNFLDDEKKKLKRLRPYLNLDRNEKDIVAVRDMLKNLAKIRSI